MAANTFRKVEPPPPKPTVQQRRQKRKRWLLTAINNYFGLDRLFGEDNTWPIKHIDRILWVTFLMIVYIFFNHRAERLVRRIQQTNKQIDEYRSQATVLRAEFDRSGKQSVLAKRMEKQGLINAATPPYKIVVKEHGQQP